MSETLAYRTRDDDYRPSHDEDDEEEEDVDESGYKTVKDALLFAIQVTPSMLKEPPADGAKKNDRSCPLIAALKCTYHLMQQRIISNPKDMMGILLFGTEETKYSDEDETSTGGWSFPHCYLLTDLDVPEAEDVKALRRLAEDSSDAVKKLFKPSKEPVAMHNVLFCANQIFQKKAANFSSRRLFIVTDDDNPHADDKAYASRAAVRAKDLYDLGVMIELFPISSPSTPSTRRCFTMILSIAQRPRTLMQSRTIRRPSPTRTAPSSKRARETALACFSPSSRTLRRRQPPDAPSSLPFLSSWLPGSEFL